MFAATQPTLPDPTHMTEVPHLSPLGLPSAIGMNPNLNPILPPPAAMGDQELSPLTKVTVHA